MNIELEPIKPLDNEFMATLTDVEWLDHMQECGFNVTYIGGNKKGGQSCLIVYHSATIQLPDPIGNIVDQISFKGLGDSFSLTLADSRKSYLEWYKHHSS